MKFGVWPPLHTQHCRFPDLFNHGKKQKTNTHLLQLPVYWGRWNPWSHLLLILLDGHRPTASHHFWNMYVTFSHSHGVHPTQSLVGLSRVSVVDPTVSIHSSGIFLSAYSVLILFWYENLRSLPTSSCIKSNFLPWPLRLSATPPLQPFPKPTHCWPPASLLFSESFFSCPQDLLPSSAPCPRNHLSDLSSFLCHSFLFMLLVPGTHPVLLSSFKDTTLLQRIKRIKQHF